MTTGASQRAIVNQYHAELDRLRTARDSGRISDQEYESRVVQIDTWLAARRIVVLADRELVILEATITCPRCSAETVEHMPTNACQFFYRCPACQEMLRPKAGDCCVFCSYADVLCPPRQHGDPCCEQDGSG